MVILTEEQIDNGPVDWHSTIDVIATTVRCLETGEFVQPIKPYLRYGDLRNRIIAMPAFVGGAVEMAGIKWIASFPGNIQKGLPRAHSVVILNEAGTGVPVAIISTALLSVIRTASVSGYVIRCFDDWKKARDIEIGVVGYGPIGQYHVKMCRALLGDRIRRLRVFDIRGVRTDFPDADEGIEVVDSWQEAYEGADIFITCTVADAPYIDRRPKDSSLHLNVSLRDYKTDVYEWFKDTMIVDSWEEVCRENTDIERMHLGKGLTREDTRSIVDMANGRCFETYRPASPVLFNPMGMAVFDIAMASHYYRKYSF